MKFNKSDKSNSNINPENTGVLLVSHGSRLPQSSETINKLTEMYRDQTDFKVGVGYMEIHEPNIPTALDELVEGTEINKVIVVPVFLAHGMHTTRDIPNILRLSEDKENKSQDDSYTHHDHNKCNESEDEHNHDHKHHHHDFEKISFEGEIIYTDPLGADPLVLEIIKNRVENASNLKE